MSNKQAAYFGIKNAKYAVKATGGTWGTPVDMPFAQSLSLNPVVNEATVAADDRIVVRLNADNGYEGTFGLSYVSDDYLKALGYAMDTAAGVAEVSSPVKKEQCIYFEHTGVYDDNTTFVIKTWLMNVKTAKAGKNFTTKGDNIEFGAYEMPVIVDGVPVMDAEGTAAYVDDNGNEVTAYLVRALPGDTNYATFGNTVPDVKEKPGE